MDLRVGHPGTQVPALTLPSSVTLGETLSLSEPQSPPLKMKTVVAEGSEIDGKLDHSCATEYLVLSKSSVCISFILFFVWEQGAMGGVISVWHGWGRPPWRPD